jgi:hypothetical protein
MSFWRIFIGIISFGFAMGHCDEGIWLIEQDFVKFGKRDVYEAFKIEQKADFLKKVGFSRFCIDDVDSSQYIYLIPVQDFNGLNALMKRRSSFHQTLTLEEKQNILPFLSTVNFFMESVHRQLPSCSFVPMGKESLLAYSAVSYYVYGINPGNGPSFEERLKNIAEAQNTSENPVCFRTWRVLFGADVPSYVIAVFGNSPKEAKNLASKLRIIDKEMKNILRQEKKGSGIMREDLSSESR